ncbi:MAG: TolC family protein [Gemmatimonadales bacterium]|nr:TolC family protein [Gemmatimonadales bacterium]
MSRPARSVAAACAALVLTGQVLNVQAQDTLHVARLQDAALSSDPRTAQLGLLRSATNLRLAVIGSGWLPQVGLNAWASHQSDVTNVGIDLPGIAFPNPAQDRWQATLDVQQTLYDGGDVARRRDLERARHAESAAAVKVHLYALRSEVNAAFFAAFLLQQRSAEFDALVTDLDARLAAVRARVDAGTALGREAAEVEAEQVRAALQRDEARASRRASLAILSDLAGQPIDTTAVLVLPTDEPERMQRPGPSNLPALRLRPEFERFRQARLRLGQEAVLATTENSPRLSAFGQAGIGLPGLDQFRTTSDAFWQAGVRLEWRPWTWRSAGRTAAALRLQQQVLETEEQALARSLTRAVAADLEEIARLQAALGEDERVVELRAEVERQARVQHDEGAITTADYVETRTDVLEARLTLQRHRVELARARAAYRTTLGLEPR